MTSRLLASISENRAIALRLAERVEIYRELAAAMADVDFSIVEGIANALELVVLDLTFKPHNDDPEVLATLRGCAGDAFKLYRALPLPIDPLLCGKFLLRMSALAVIGDRGADAARFLRILEEKGMWPQLPLTSTNWGNRTWATIIDVWLRLIRKKGWEDRDLVLVRIAGLRQNQSEFEQTYFDSLDAGLAKSAALELIGQYHLAKAADILAHFITDGVVEGNPQVQQLLDSHFDRAIGACEPAQLRDLEPLTRLLNAAASQMVQNSIWTVTRAVNSRVTHFVQTLVARGRGDKAIFDVLPPQRRTLAEKGLLGSSRRAVVVSLPTSSGKTLIAEFRILQALNQFDAEEGWIAYLSPTKSLVNQVTRQLRRDFELLEIPVERVSPALEIDGAEASLLTETEKKAKFRVLVTTPEKLDLLLRQGWEAKIGRPLTLVIVDEAHNLQSGARGLKLELLLATINKECRNAQFLLLTPFINNAREVARWLGGQNSDDVSLGLDWQPNDRAIGIVRALQGTQLGANRFDYSLTFEIVHTARNTLALEELVGFPKAGEIATSYSQANKKGTVAAVAAQHLKERGPVIIMHARPDWAWALARRLIIDSNRRTSLHPDIKLVQEYLRLEMGEAFPLIEMLGFGIGVHHSGLPDEVRSLVEWLFESSHLDFLVATTTIAQGINFPVSGVVLASHQYFSIKGAEDMPPEDFWNIAGRAGRVLQGQLGVVALAADSESSEAKLKEFINQATGDLNSSLIEMALRADEKLADLGRIVYSLPEWSSFVQYLTHTYQQMGKPTSFAEQVEQVLRGTLGFEKLRTGHSRIAKLLLTGVADYTRYMERPNQPLKLVDSTGFSLQSVLTVLTNKGDIDESSWNAETLFTSGNNTLENMMGILLRVPELRENLTAATGGAGPDGNKLASIIKDWVGGASIVDIASKYFKKPEDDDLTAITKCGQDLFGRLTQTASWGLSALLAITGGELSKEEFQQLSNLPSRVYYGVNEDHAITMRLLGVPRTAANRVAEYCAARLTDNLSTLRRFLTGMQDDQWREALGDAGTTYRKVWRILEGLE